MKVICIGGGAASFFFAANAAALLPEHEFIIAEQGKKVLNKVEISGGGRCNLTHHCFDPLLLVENYPRGRRELLGPFYHFGPEQTVDWFESRGVETKIEEDGRMFPKANTSQAVIDCLENQCRRYGVKVWTQAKVTNIRALDNGRSGFEVSFLNSPTVKADVLFIGAGSSKSIWQLLGNMGHKIVPPVPSLFTFLIKDDRIQGLQGLSVSHVELEASGTNLTSSGPILITHKGLSGPSILKMSAHGARQLHELNYRFEVNIDFRPDLCEEDILAWRSEYGGRNIGDHRIWELPKRLVHSLLAFDRIDKNKRIGDLNKEDWEKIVGMLKKSTFRVSGQNRFKEEFVTAGGVDLKDVDFTSFSSKRLENLYFAGEILNIDAVTGGFNFQAAWTGAYLAAHDIAERLSSTPV
jgi:predicted Rossmann fold flavoprotein